MEEADSSKTDIEFKPIVSHNSVSPVGNEVSQRNEAQNRQSGYPAQTQ
jgi:hypothetical protein